MQVVVIHRITDPDKFFAADAEQVASGGSSGAKGQQFYPSTDRDFATCLWEAESLDRLREYLDEATEGFAENTYFEVDGSRAMGLPEGATA